MLLDLVVAVPESLFSASIESRSLSFSTTDVYFGSTGRLPAS